MVYTLCGRDEGVGRLDLHVSGSEHLREEWYGSDVNGTQNDQEEDLSA